MSDAWLLASRSHPFKPWLLPNGDSPVKPAVGKRTGLLASCSGSLTHGREHSEPESGLMRAPIVSYSVHVCPHILTDRGERVSAFNAPVGIQMDEGRQAGRQAR